MGLGYSPNEIWTLISAARENLRLREALQVASDRMHLICGSYMAISHGEPEKNLWDSINTMGDDMTVVNSALDGPKAIRPPQKT